MLRHMRLAQGKQPGGGTRRRWGDLCTAWPARFRWGSKLTNPTADEHASAGLRRRHERSRYRCPDRAARRADHISHAIGSTDTSTMPTTTSSKFSLTTGTLPKK